MNVWYKNTTDCVDCSVYTPIRDPHTNPNFTKRLLAFNSRKPRIRIKCYISLYRMHIGSFLSTFRMVSHKKFRATLDLVAWTWVCRMDLDTWEAPCRMTLILYYNYCRTSSSVVAGMQLHRVLSHGIPCDISHGPSVRHITGMISSSKIAGICL